MKKLLVGGFGLGLALCLPGLGAVYTGGDCDASLLAHRWSFNGDLTDSVGGVTATSGGNPTFANGVISLPGGANGTAGYVEINQNVVPLNGPFTIEVFATLRGLKNWGRIFSFGKGPYTGSAPANWFFMSWTQGTNANQDRIGLQDDNVPSGAFTLDNSLQPYTVDTPWHIAATFIPNFDGEGRMKVLFVKENFDGTIRRTSEQLTPNPFSFSRVEPDLFYFGRSRWSGDNDAQADYNEVRIWNTALTAEQLAWSARLGADTLPTAAAAAAESATITTSSEPGGKVSIDGAAAAASGSTTVAKNQLVTLTAVPDSNYHFTGWTGDLGAIQSGTTADATITVYAANAAAFTATFRQNTATWTGAGANDLWSTAANWQDSLLPVEHAQVVFNGDVRTANQNDQVSALDKITFGANAAAHTLTGNAVTLVSLENLSSATQTVDLAVTGDSSTLSVANSGNLVFNQAVDAPTLNLTGSGTTIFNQQVASTVHNLDSGATVLFNGGVSSPNDYEGINGGNNNIYVQGTSQVKSLCLNSGDITWNFSGADSVFNASADVVAANNLGAGKHATINIGGGTMDIAADLRTDWSSGNGTINQTDGTVTARNILVVGRNSVGDYNLSGGMLHHNTSGNTSNAHIGENAGSTGTLNISGDGFFKARWNVFVGQYGTGTINLSGGDAEIGGWASIGRYSTGVGTLNITGGTFTQTTASDGGVIVGEEGRGTLNVSGSGVLDIAHWLSIAHASANAVGTVNLTDGGTIRTPAVVLRNVSPTSMMYVDGGTLAAKGSNAVINDFIGTSQFVVGPKGMTLDTGDNTVILGRGLDNGSSSGTITKTGTGTLSMPASSAAPIKVQQGSLAAAPATIGGSVDPSLTSHLIHRWSFNGDLTDSVGGLDATAVGTAFTEDNAAIHTTGGGKSVSYVNLDPAALPKDRPFTLEIFATPKVIYSWSRIFSFGKGAPNSDHKENFFMSWTRSTNQGQDQVRFRYNGGGNAISVDETLQPFTLNTKWHIVLTYVPNVTPDGKGRFYWSKTDMNGNNHRESSAITSVPVDLAAWGMDGFYLGRSYWTADLDADADYDEVRIWDVALTPEQIVANAKLGPDTLPGVELLHRWSFNGDAKDSVGGTTAALEGAVTLTDKDATTTGGTTGSGYINLGTGMFPAEGGPVTLEFWATQRGVYQWARVFDIGPNNQNYLTLAWNYQTNTGKDRCEIKKGNTALLTVDDTLVGYVLGTEYHISMTIEPAADGKAFLRWVRRDARTGLILKQGSGTTSQAWSVADIAGAPFYLGHSQYYSGDHNANATYNEVRVWKGVLSDAQLARSVALGPDVLPTESAGAIREVELAAGTTFTTQAGDAAVGKLSGTGTVTGTGALTVVDTLDIAGEEVGTMTLDGNLAVKGTWLLDANASACDLLTGTGTLDLSQATIAARDPAQLRGGALLATVGNVTGHEQATVALRGYKLRYHDGRLTLAVDGLYIIVR